VMRARERRSDEATKDVLGGRGARHVANPARQGRWMRRLQIASLRWVAPRSFFMGVGVAFVMCCVLGRVVVEKNIFKDFKRFHLAIHPSFLFFPTALQVESLAREKLPAEKIGVIIGGDSVFLGAGQRASHLWSEDLAKRLGSEYAVLNLADRGAYPQEKGEVAFERMRGTHSRLIYLIDVPPMYDSSMIEGTEAYLYFMADARARGMLPGWGPRDKAMAAAQAGRLKPLDEKWLGQLPAGARREANSARAARVRTYEEIGGGAWGNRYASFNDLWNTVGYRWLFTVVEDHMVQRDGGGWRRFLAPRKKFSDEDGPTVPGPAYGYYDEYTEVHKFDSWAGWDMASWRPATKECLTAMFPVWMRGQTLGMARNYSPYYTEKMLSGSRQAIAVRQAAMVEMFGELGMHGVMVRGDLKADDYLDLQHFSEQGGVKLAEQAEGEVRKLARELGYVK